jgi:putative ABC transport system permease protein
MMGIRNWLGQAASVSKLGLETIWERKGASATAVVGIAGVVAVAVATLSIAQGFRRTMTAGGDPALALVLRSGADTEMMSFLWLPDTRVIADAPGVARSELGPLASPELFVVINLPKRDTGTDANVPLRGVWPVAFQVNQAIEICAGRNFQPGRNEAIVGIGAVREFAGLELGQSIQAGHTQWTIVGHFRARGSLAESEIWTDATLLQNAYHRGNTFQSVWVRLERPEAFDQFKVALLSDPRLNVKVLRQTEYFADQSATVYNLVNGLGRLIALLMGLGAVFGAWNTMHSAVAARTREIATLRALGFGAGPVVVAVLVEALCLGLAGGVLGGLVAYGAFNGYRAATINWQSFSQVAFAFTVTPSLLVEGIAYATGIALLGGLFPALRAARLPVATALREL